MKSLLILLASLLTGLNALGAIQTKVIEYKSGDQVLEGFLAYDDTVKSPRPGVLIVHQWKGLTEYEQKRAEMLAGLGYVAFCADIYGKGVRPTEVKDASALAGKYKGDRALYRERLKAALDVLAAQPQVEKEKLAAMGYCFGGTGALEVARSGAAVRGVISFHGGLGTPTPADAKTIKGRVLVLHGADDPFVPPAEVDGFKKEMAEAEVGYEFVAYPGAVHSFTHWTAGSDNSKGAAYNKEADEQSWDAMKAFLAKVFSK
jgi:dienelactone hydrolase